jgi:hypothetical protein
MSTAIAVMNRRGVALACDSAYTLTLWDDELERTYKTFNTVKKLFRLSGATPVGIMQFKNPYLIEVPLETIFSMYNGHLGDTKFRSLQDYVRDFIGFLETNPVLFPTEAQDSFLQKILSEYFEGMMSSSENECGSSFSEKQDYLPVSESLESKIERHIKKLSEREPLDCFPETFVPELLLGKQQLLDEVAESVFAGPLFSGSILDSVRQLGGLVATRFMDPSMSCGIAFAGYGEEDIFPHLISLKADGLIAGRLRYVETVNEKLSREESVHIESFDSAEMIGTFFEGIDPRHLDSLKSLRDDPEISSAHDFVKRLEALISGHVTDIFNVIGSLPQPDLAEVAEELIKLECLNQKLSEKHEFTVGPIDVALITKSGFRWVKNKDGAE